VGIGEIRIVWIEIVIYIIEKMGLEERVRRGMRRGAKEL
jgi:hypothetical protein